MEPYFGLSGTMPRARDDIGLPAIRAFKTGSVLTRRLRTRRIPGHTTRMRNTSASLHWTLLIALLASAGCAVRDDNAEEARTQEETVPRSNELAGLPSPSPYAAVNQRRAPGTSPRLLPDVVLAGHTDEASHVAFSPDGSRIITTSWAFTSLPPASEPYS